MVPEAERQVEVIAVIGQAVEGESQLVVLQELQRRREIGVQQAGEMGRAASRWPRGWFQLV